MYVEEKTNETTTENKEVRYLLIQSRNVGTEFWMNVSCFNITPRQSVVDWGEYKTIESS